MKKLAICIPTFNRADLLDRLLKSIPPSSKIIVSICDDGSNDNTSKILSENSALIDKYVNNETNFGKGYSVKKGLEISEGQYVIFQDGDLEYDPEDFIKRHLL